MKKRSYWIIMGLLIIALVATGYWGNKEAVLSQKLQNRAESQYQKAFFELTWHMDMITGQLAQILASTSSEQNLLELSTIWRQVFAAQANIGALPLALVPLSKTEKFLSDTGEITYAFLTRAAQEKKDLSPDEVKVIEDLYNRSKTLKNELSKLAAQVLNQELSWTEVEVVAVQAGTEIEDNTILDGFNLMEKKMEEYPEINVGEDMTRLKPDTKIVKGTEEISLQKAEEIAGKWWFQTTEKHPGKLAYEGTGDIPTYGIDFSAAKEGEPAVFIDISKLDGTVIRAIKPKTVSTAKLKLEEGEKAASDFLQTHGLRGMERVQTEQQDSTGVFTFVPTQGGILLYPDQVKVQVALDTGEIIGYEGTPYYMYHRERDIPEAEITEDEIKRLASPYLKIEKIQQALIVNSWGREVLAWEIRGSVNEEKFALFYNAVTGAEEEIIRTTQPPKYNFNLEG